MSYLKLAVSTVFLVGSLQAYATLCLSDGDVIGVHPGALQCCPGLDVEPAPSGVLGSAGTCRDNNKTCLGPGENIGVYPGALKCCSGLGVEPPPTGLMGSGGTCREKIKTCLEEGEAIGNYPNALSCCPGLDIKQAEFGNMGSAGTCISRGNIRKVNINNSELILKENGIRDQSGLIREATSGALAE